MKNIDTLIILLTAVIFLVVIIMFAIYSFFLKKKGELLLKQNNLELEFQKQLSEAKTEMRIQTLNYIAQELHDDIGQKLSVAKMMTNNSTHLAHEELCKEMNLLLGECIKDIRELSKIYVADNLADFNFIENLKLEVDRIKKFKLIDIDFKTNTEEIKMGNHQSLILFRIIQEAINNILKHAKATYMLIKVEDSPHHLSVQIDDNGKGFNYATIKEGHGLKNIQNRAKIINATISINSESKVGTNILINFNKPIRAGTKMKISEKTK